MSELSEVEKLRAVIHTAHDHLHNGRPDEAHEALHCGVNDHPEEVETGNITSDAAANLHEFINEFNALAKRRRQMACVVAIIPSATRPGAVSVQLGGHVGAIQMTREMMGKGPTLTPDDLLGRRQSAASGGVSPARNRACPCGSGRKFKHCCGRNG